MLIRIGPIEPMPNLPQPTQQLAYLNQIEKFNCAYCAYANGLATYFKRVAGMTEQYWCPVKHARRILEAHANYDRFADYGDAAGYRQELEKTPPPSCAMMNTAMGRDADFRSAHRHCREISGPVAADHVGSGVYPASRYFDIR